MSKLTEEEKITLSLLADANIAFCQLEEYHSSDAREFTEAIHKAQNIIMARLAVREHPEIFHRISVSQSA